MNNKIKKLAKQFGADYFGVAGLNNAKEYINYYSENTTNDYPFAVSIGIILPNEIVNQLSNRDNRAVRVNYKSHAYEIINHRLNIAASSLSSFIQSKGCRTLPIPAAERCSDEKIAAVFSHKLAANLAGLGWIGKNSLLITPENGPRVRWSSILTNAPLKPAHNEILQKCGNCMECVNICPVKAFTGRAFNTNETRELRFDAKKCEDYHTAMKNNKEIAVCGMCVYVCPYGKK